ncbi:hypothetical protein CRG98_004943, partial [Punica granatum]
MGQIWQLGPILQRENPPPRRPTGVVSVLTRFGTKRRTKGNPAAHCLVGIFYLPVNRFSLPSLSGSFQMEAADPSAPELGAPGTAKSRVNAKEVEGFGRRLDEVLMKVDQLEQRINDVEQFYLNLSKKQTNTSKGSSVAKEKERERPITSIKKQQQEAARREAAAAKRMQELIRHFGTILRQ